MNLLNGLEKLKKLITNPDYRFLIMSSRGFYRSMDDRNYVIRYYKAMTGKELNLDNPRAFNEKIQWLKLYDRKPIYNTLVDKYEVKNWVSKKIGDDYVVPTIGVYNNVEEIPFNDLPKDYVIKCTHDSGSVMIIRGGDIPANEITGRISKFLKQSLYYIGREWAYKDVYPRIIIEEHLKDGDKLAPDDYKIFCFDGYPAYIQVDIDRFGNHRRNIYSAKWELMNVSICYPSDFDTVVERPKNLDKMLELSATLSKGIPQVRVDFYCFGEKIYFGEMTLYHGSGTEKFMPESFGEEMGNLIKLPSRGKKTLIEVIGKDGCLTQQK